MYGTIGILTGGGDAPGLNAVIRAVVKTAEVEYGWKVVGIEDGFEGLLALTLVGGFFLVDAIVSGRREQFPISIRASSDDVRLRNVAAGGRVCGLPLLKHRNR